MAITKRAAALGARGEDVAVEFIREQFGWLVLDRNWRCPVGEIDIVAAEQESGTLIVIEVKTRSGTGFGHPFEALTEPKIARLRRLAAAWAKAHEVHARRIRVDGISVLLPPDGTCLVSHLPGLAGL